MNSRYSRNRVSHERWLVSYADFITLLFAFFVVMYAFAKADQKKQSQVSIAINTAFRSLGIFPNASRLTAQGTNAVSDTDHPSFPAEIVVGENVQSPSRVRDDLYGMQSELRKALSHQIAEHTVSIRMGRNGLVISLREAGFFPSGSAVPSPATLPMLRQIAKSLGRTSYEVRVEGHTDNMPVHNAEFQSNWELSTARAARIARMLLDLHAVAPDRLSAAGYAEFHPVASNQTAEGRAKNRRVDLVVMPRVQINFAESAIRQPEGSWHRITDEDSTAH